MSRSLAQRYRAEAYNVIATATCTRPTELVIDGIDVTQAEFEYAVTYECALDVADHANEFDTRATAPQRPVRVSIGRGIVGVIEALGGGVVVGWWGVGG
ncbi:hypothetical protein A8144_13030 [Mycobacterium leprae 3125609]|nr:hypothetical protein A8144_13030 [Mycobacterium leprae 3125609]